MNEELLRKLDQLESISQSISSDVRHLIATLKLYARPNNWKPTVQNEFITIEGDAVDGGEAARECLERLGIRWDGE